MGLDAVVFARCWDDQRIEWHSYYRYFSESYPRGYWPQIRLQITTLQERFPELLVYYTSDMSDLYGEPSKEWLATPELLAALDRAWVQFGYRDEEDA